MGRSDRCRDHGGVAKRMTWKGLAPVVALSHKVYQKGIALGKAAMQAVEKNDWSAIQHCQVRYCDQPSTNILNKEILFEKIALVYLALRYDPAQRRTETTGELQHRPAHGPVRRRNYIQWRTGRRRGPARRRAGTIASPAHSPVAPPGRWCNIVPRTNCAIV